MLFVILQRIWKTRKAATGFRLGWQIFIPKGDDTSGPDLMRPITILNSEARLFWSGFERKLSRFMIKNDYIDLKIQKAFASGLH